MYSWEENLLEMPNVTAHHHDNIQDRSWSCLCWDTLTCRADCSLSQKLGLSIKYVSVDVNSIPIGDYRADVCLYHKVGWQWLRNNTSFSLCYSRFKWKCKICLLNSGQSWYCLSNCPEHSRLYYASTSSIIVENTSSIILKTSSL